MKEVRGREFYQVSNSGGIIVPKESIGKIVKVVIIEEEGGERVNGSQHKKMSKLPRLYGCRQIEGIRRYKKCIQYVC